MCIHKKANRRHSTCLVRYQRCQQGKQVSNVKITGAKGHQLMTETDKSR